MLIQFLDSKKTLKKLQEEREEMIDAFAFCVENNNIEDARLVSKKIKSISYKILNVNHKIEFTI